MKNPVKLFISYSHKDEALVESLESHLSLLKREHVIESWHDRKIRSGDEWSKEIDENIRSADIIILLVSADFLASDYCYDQEVKQAISMHNAGEAVVVPIIARPCDWMSAPFSKLQALPRDGKPITSFESIDEALMEAAQEIRKIATSVEPSYGLPLKSSIELSLNVDFDSFTEADEAKFLEAVKKLLSVENEIKIINKRRGSVKIKLMLSRAEIARLQMAAASGELSEFPIIDAEVLPDYEAPVGAEKRPRVFVGSSTESLEVAETIQVNLDEICEVTVWHQGVFSPSGNTLQELISASRQYDFAILILSPDDMIESRGGKSTTPRDNVLFELGLFMGAIGSDRTLVLFDRTSNVKLPSDLSGTTMVTYQPHSTGDLQAALGAPCTKIKRHILDLGALST